MPYWDFKCSTCNTTTTQFFVNHKAALDAVCPTCSDRPERLPAAGSFVLKGSGFYKNDYGSGR